METVLVVPDVHGRRYLLEAAKRYSLEHPTRRIIFLGDYLDPYPHEWDEDPELEVDVKDTCKEDAFELFKEIVDFAKSHPNTVTLLLGNHKIIKFLFFLEKKKFGKIFCALDEKSSSETGLIAGTPEMVISSEAEKSERSSTIPEMEVESSDSKCPALNE